MVFDKGSPFEVSASTGIKLYDIPKVHKKIKERINSPCQVSLTFSIHPSNLQLIFFRHGETRTAGPPVVYTSTSWGILVTFIFKYWSLGKPTVGLPLSYDHRPILLEMLWEQGIVMCNPDVSTLSWAWKLQGWQNTKKWTWNRNQTMMQKTVPMKREKSFVYMVALHHIPRFYSFPIIGSTRENKIEKTKDT